MTKNMFKRGFMSFIAVAALSASVTACGSGSDSSSSDSTTAGRQRNAALTVSLTNPVLPAQIAMGYRQATILDSAGRFHHWGQLDSYPDPELKPGATKFVRFAVGGFHIYAWDDLDNEYSWGVNYPNRIETPKPKNGGTKFVSIVPGRWSTHAIDDLGQIYSWGYWQAEYESRIPKFINGGTKWSQVSGGWKHMLAIDDKGNLYTWGTDESSGRKLVPALQKGATKFTKIAAGYYESLALDDLGNMYFFSDNGSVVIKPTKTGGTKFVNMASTEHSYAALDDAGNLYITSPSFPSQEKIPAFKNGGTKWVQFGLGYSSVLAMDDKNNLYVWGDNNFGEFNIPQIVTQQIPAMPIAMGGSQAFGINDKGAISKFDSSNDGWGFPSDEKFTSIAAGLRHALAIDADGNVQAWGDWMSGQTAVPLGLSNVVQVAAGMSYSEALRSDGTVVEWGAHTAPKGKLLEKPDSLPPVRALAGGLTHVLALTRDGKVIGWGNNENGKATSPADLADVIAIAANSSCSAALTKTGKIVYWGTCPTSVVATTQVDSATKIALTEATAVVLKSDGSIQTWGDKNEWDQLLDAPTEGNFTAISAGMYAVMAVTDTGDVKSWGYNLGNTITVPTEFGGLPPQDPEECTDCNVEEGKFVVTDEMLDQAAIEIIGLLTKEQLARFIKAIGGVYSSTMTPDDIQKLIDNATAAQKASALKVANDATPSLVETKAAVAPATNSPLTKVGTSVTAKQAIAILGIKKATKASFVVPKNALTTCSVTKSAVTTTSAGSCSVVVKYTVKKKVKKSVLLLMVG